MFIIIASLDQNRGLGNRGELLFHLKRDMQFFKATTSGHPVIMGRKTWESLPKKLPNRTNIVVTHNLENFAPVMPDQIITNFTDFLKEHENDPDPCYIIGGAKIYEQALPYTKTLLLTEITAQKPADTFFPDFDPQNYAKTLIEKGSENGLDFTINRYDKI